MKLSSKYRFNNCLEEVVIEATGAGFETQLSM